jgi:hypothetical protein
VEERITKGDERERKLESARGSAMCCGWLQKSWLFISTAAVVQLPVLVSFSASIGFFFYFCFVFVF